MHRKIPKNNWAQGRKTLFSTIAVEIETKELAVKMANQRSMKIKDLIATALKKFDHNEKVCK